MIHFSEAMSMPLLSGGGAGAASAGASAAFGPIGLGIAGIQGLAGIAGGLMGQQSAREAQEEANKNMVRGWGYDMFSRDKEKATQLAALREGNYFMQSPVFQQNQGQDFRQAFMLSGKFDPYLTAMASKFG